MRRRHLRLFLVLALVLLLVPALAIGAARSRAQADQAATSRSDNRPYPAKTRQAELKVKALDAKLAGKAKGKVKMVAKGQYVDLAREGQGMVWTVLGEFADFAHNQIAEPDRATDNSTIWVPDFNKNYFDQLIYSKTKGDNSMANFYIEQSSNRYTVDGEAVGWIPVPGNAASYDDDLGGPAVWQFLIDSVDGWYNQQIAAGKTPAEINAYLAQYDVYDVFDFDGDGNFNEPDGYIDTFQSVHAGEGNEAGGGELGDDAIWSHSWFAYYNLFGSAGPAFNKSGGIQVGDSDFWVGKYTIQPENGGVGVFVHEYGHDLGLPDLYDTQGGENGTGFWTLMSSGSWLDDGKDTIGNKSSHMGAWEKFQLGWLNYAVATAGKKVDIKLGPMETNTKQAQGMFVILPQKPVTTHIADPFEGSYFYFSGSADNLKNSMFKQFNLAPGSTLAAKVNYGIEVGYDYANVIASTDGGATWQTVPTNLSNSIVEANGIDGSTNGNWVDLTADLSAYSGNVLLGFRYWTDAGVSFEGFMIDNIQITGYPLDGAETDTGWTFAPTTGFRVTTGTESKLYNNYYVGEFRQYWGYDKTLKVGPYFFGYLNNPDLQNYVDHFPYQQGLLINYWDTSQQDNNTSVHPGAGLILPVDAHPKALIRVDGNVWRNRIQAYDATFGLTRTSGIPNIHVNSVLSPVPSLPAASVFNDTKSWWDPANPWGSVMVPNTGTQIRIQGIDSGGFMQLQVAPVK